jgi:hypothetical protein
LQQHTSEQPATGQVRQPNVGLSRGSPYKLAHVLTYFPKWDNPSLCIKEMHTTIFYFHYSTKSGEKPYNNYTNWSSHQTQVSKHHQTSTTQEEKPRH